MSSPPAGHIIQVHLIVCPFWNNHKPLAHHKYTLPGGGGGGANNPFADVWFWGGLSAQVHRLRQGNAMNRFLANVFVVLALVGGTYQNELVQGLANASLNATDWSLLTSLLFLGMFLFGMFFDQVTLHPKVIAMVEEWDEGDFRDEGWTVRCISTWWWTYHLEMKPLPNVTTLPQAPPFRSIPGRCSLWTPHPHTWWGSGWRWPHLQATDDLWTLGGLLLTLERDLIDEPNPHQYRFKCFRTQDMLMDLILAFVIFVLRNAFGLFGISLFWGRIMGMIIISTWLVSAFFFFGKVHETFHPKRLESLERFNPSLAERTGGWTVTLTEVKECGTTYDAIHFLPPSGTTA